MPADSDAVVLRGGLTVPLAALQLAWDLEHRGFQLVEDQGGLLVSPRSKLTADDSQAIRQHRDELLSLLRYSEAIQ